MLPHPNKRINNEVVHCFLNASSIAHATTVILRLECLAGPNILWLSLSRGQGEDGRRHSCFVGRFNFPLLVNTNYGRQLYAPYNEPSA